MRITKPDEKPVRIVVPRPVEKPKRDEPIPAPNWPVRIPQPAER